MRREKRAATPADELRRLLNTNYADGDVGLRLGYSGCRKVAVENGVQLIVGEKVPAELHDFFGGKFACEIRIPKLAGQIEFCGGYSSVDDAVFVGRKRDSLPCSKLLKD